MRSTWDLLAEADPMWAVASHPQMRRKDPSPWQDEEWLASGESDLEHILGLWKVDLRDKRVLEVGCGPGRLARPLCERAARVTGVDISLSMLSLAKRYNPDLSNLDLILGNGMDLRMVRDGSHELVLSWHVMQHVPQPQVVMALLAEISRVLKDDGCAFVHIPQRSARNLRWRAGRSLRALGLKLDPTGLLSAVPYFGVAKELIIRKCVSLGFQRCTVIENDPGNTYYLLTK